MIANIYSDREIEEFVREQYKEQLIDIIESLDIIGMKCMNEAKLAGNYKDHTHNLRGSIEYAVVLDGKIVKGGGKQNAFLLEAIEEKEGLGLVLVAGMEYASYVEFGTHRIVNGKTIETKPYNVISSAEVLMDKLIEELYAKYQ